MTQLQALAWCQTAFPAIPALLVDAQPYGASPTEDDVMICVHNNYSNSRVFGNLAAQLFHTAGYRDGLAAMWGADRDRPSGVDLTQGAVNFHLRFASTSGDYEVTDAFHAISTETFAWLDDTTDIRSHAEVIRTPRDQTLTFVNGGPTSQPLRFDSASDADSFLLFGDAGASYRLQGTTVGGDLCATAYDWSSGALLAIASGCPDGMSSTGVDLTVPTPTGRRMVFRLNNVLGTNVTYSLQLSAVGDDYPSAHADFATAQPLRASDAAFPVEETGFMASTTDLDFFRYDVPLGDTGALTFTVTTSARFPPFLDVYTAVGTDQPSFWTVASAIGSVTVPSPSPGWRYYVVVRPRPGGTGNTYAIRATQAGCSPAWSCNETGTYNFPRFLASSVGAHHWNAIDQGDAGSTWAACRDGASCDWYRVDLAAGERFTGTVSRVFDSLCALELAVFAPPEQVWWVRSDGSTAPIVTDVAGSMENRGAQLTFVARRAGTYRVRVRGTTTWNCPAYQLTATQGAQDADQPPPIH
ncbi:MAG: hypothetical protein IT379_36600 [Deltaproteobacteria bacterium]|nr:hypothetical protein [Deltaproteobacteria bacterium]